VKELDGSIDIWDTGPLGYEIGGLEERSSGQNIGSITADVPPQRHHYRRPATDPRATIWACFKHGVENYFFWEAFMAAHRQKVGERRQDVWATQSFRQSRSPNSLKMIKVSTAMAC